MKPPFQQGGTLTDVPFCFKAFPQWLLKTKMAKDYSKKFYDSAQWKRISKAYLKSVGGYCERCMKEGKYVIANVAHHKEYITPNNINDPNITLNIDNLEALCNDCHNKEHKKNNFFQKRYFIDKDGKATAPR